MARGPHHLLPVAAAALSAAVLSVPTGARAQLVVSGTVESQYRVRGVSLTNGEPDARIGLSYDHSSGVYAGASLIAGQTVRDGIQPLGYLAYVGFARQLWSGLDWDVGLATSHITIDVPAHQTVVSGGAVVYDQEYTRHYRADYSEAYAGLALRNVSARFYVSPDYLGQGLRTAYLDVTGGIQPKTWLRLSAHAGVLTPLGGWVGPDSGRERYDLRAGAALEFHHAEVGLAVTAATPLTQYPIGVRQRSSAVVLSATGFF